MSYSPKPLARSHRHGIGILALAGLGLALVLGLAIFTTGGRGLGLPDSGFFSRQKKVKGPLAPIAKTPEVSAPTEASQSPAADREVSKLQSQLKEQNLLLKRTLVELKAALKAKDVRRMAATRKGLKKIQSDRDALLQKLSSLPQANQ